MKSKLLEKFNNYFYIPPKSKLLISKRNLRACSVLCYVLLFFGISGLFIEYKYYNLKRIISFQYYLFYLLIGLVIRIAVFFIEKKNNYLINQILISLAGTSICLVISRNIAIAGKVYDVIIFYIAYIVMMIVFEMHPFFYIFNILFFFCVSVMSNFDTPEYNFLITLDNAIFCCALVFFSFYKRKLVSQREIYKQELEEKNQQLSNQNIELSHQKDSLLINKQNLEDEVFFQSKELQLQKERIIRIQNNTILSLSNLVESRDEETGEHVQRTSDYVALIAKNVLQKGLYPNLTENEVSLFIKAAPMHDIGKIVIPDVILKKPLKLIPEERENIKNHTIRGEKIVEVVLGAGEDEEYVKIAKEIVLYHHEKYDGSGYPYGLKGKDIPLSARIMAIADVFDALVSPRCYKEPAALDEAFNIISDSAGSHFDPELTEIFVESKEDVSKIFYNYQKC